ncbi:MAG: glycoside hydrolase domain-containing protein [Nitrosopumilaceae archaeon]
MTEIEDASNLLSKTIQRYTGDAATYLGFDKGSYPGDTLMQTLWNVSPYFFTGYYLDSPNAFSKSWMGNRTTLKNMGWGFLVIYVGQLSPDPNYPKRKSDLNFEQGGADAANAFDVAQNEGFPNGTIIFLDIENTESILPTDMINYFKGWMDYFIKNEQYNPGVYCFTKLAQKLTDTAQEVYQSNIKNGSPAFWVFAPDKKKFKLTDSPAKADATFTSASVWQGKKKYPEKSFSKGVVLPPNFDNTIDINVAYTPNPSNG